MKYTFKFLQTGGVPLTNDLMSLIEEAYGIFEVLGDLSGHLTILKGCEVNGSTINPGIVSIEGKLYYFEGGLLNTTVFIHTEELQETFQDQTTKTLIEKRTVKFGQSTVVYNWSEFARLETLKAIQVKVNNSVTQQEFAIVKADIELLKLKTAPIVNDGIVWAWRTPIIPVGWKECLDVRGKTIVGLDPDDPDFDSLGDVIGEKTHTLSLEEMPEHWHEVKGYAGQPSVNNTWDHISAPTTAPSSNRTGKAGNSMPHNNIQPSIIYYFIEPNFQ